MLAALGSFIASFAVSGLAKVRAQILQFIKNIGAAMARIPKIVLTAPFRALIASANAAHKAVGKLSGLVGTLSKTVAGVGSIGVVGAIAGKGIAVKEAMKDSEEYIRTTEKIANTLGSSVEQMSVFNAYAGALGFELDDARQAFTQFFGVAGEAQKGKNEYAAVFAQVGIDMTDAYYKNMDVMQLLQAFATKLEKFSGSQRTGILTALFGDDDATKVATLLDKMAKSPLADPDFIRGRAHTRDMNQRIKERAVANGQMFGLDNVAFDYDWTEYEKLVYRMKQAGSIVTGEDVKLQQEYKAGLEDLKMTFRGLQFTIFRTFGPPFIKLMRMAANWIIVNRNQIVNGLVEAWNWVAHALHDFRVIFLGMEQKLAIKNGWMQTLKTRLIQLEGIFIAFGVAAKSIGVALASVFLKLNGKSLGGFVSGMSLDIDEVMEIIRAGVIEAGYIISDLIYVLSFQDASIGSAFGIRMAAWRDFIIALVQDTWDRVVEAFDNSIQLVLDIVDAFLLAWNSFMDGFSSRRIEEGANAWNIFGVAVGVALAWLAEFAEQLFNVFVVQEKATGKFAWINTVVDWFKELQRNVDFAWHMFKDFYSAVDGFLDQFGIDLTQTLMFLGFLQLSGILPIITGAIGLLMTGLLALFSGAGIAGLVTGGKIALGFIALIALIGKAEQLLRAFQVDKLFNGITEGIYGVQEAIDGMKTSSDASFARYGRKPGMSAEEQARATAGPSVPPGSVWSYITAGSGKPFGAQGTTDVTFTMPGTTAKVRAVVPTNDFERARQAQILSPTGGK